MFQEEIKDEIDKICAKLTTADLQKQCASFVDEYLQLVLSLLAQELDPNAVCQEIGLCTKIRASTGELYKNIITRRFFWFCQVMDLCIQLKANIASLGILVLQQHLTQGTCATGLCLRKHST